MLGNVGPVEQLVAGLASPQSSGTSAVKVNRTWGVIMCHYVSSGVR